MYSYDEEKQVRVIDSVIDVTKCYNSGNQIIIQSGKEIQRNIDINIELSSLTNPKKFGKVGDFYISHYKGDTMTTVARNFHNQDFYERPFFKKYQQQILLF